MAAIDRMLERLQLDYLDLYEDEHLVQGLAIGLHEAFTTA